MQYRGKPHAAGASRWPGIGMQSIEELLRSVDSVVPGKDHGRSPEEDNK
jgi:hypothetical protein